MSFWKLIKRSNNRQLKSLIILLVKHPFFMIFTVKATLSVMKITQKEFPDIHGRHNKANAFRHALWNVFIAYECCRFSKNKEAVLKWTKDFTDWHEEFFPNKKLAKMMDLHNNSIGRQLFLDRVRVVKNKKEWITVVKIQLEKAIQIYSEREFINYLKQLVYLET